MGAKRKTDVSSANAPGVDHREETLVVGDFTLKKDDPCIIDGDKEGRYKFKYVDVYTNGNRAATIYGGPPGHGMFRTVGADVVLPSEWAKRKAKKERTSGAGPAVPKTKAAPSIPETPKPKAKEQPTVQDLKARRTGFGATRAAVASAAGVSQAALDKLERGESTRDADALSRVLAALDALEA